MLLHDICSLDPNPKTDTTADSKDIQQASDKKETPAESPGGAENLDVSPSKT
jgi:hypothetical protein